VKSISGFLVGDRNGVSKKAWNLYKQFPGGEIVSLWSEKGRKKRTARISSTVHSFGSVQSKFSNMLF
jgi:hypothetical protein